MLMFDATFYLDEVKSLISVLISIGRMQTQVNEIVVAAIWTKKIISIVHYLGI